MNSWKNLVILRQVLDSAGELQSFELLFQYTTWRSVYDPLYALV